MGAKAAVGIGRVLKAGVGLFKGRRKKVMKRRRKSGISRRKSRKMPIKISTQVAVKQVKDERNIDIAVLTKSQAYGKYVKQVTNKLLNELSFSKYPNHLSLKKIAEKLKKTLELLKTLKEFGRSLNYEANNRLSNTKTNCAKLKDKLGILGKNKEYKMNYKTLDKHFGIYDSLRASNFPSTVNFI